MSKWWKSNKSKSIPMNIINDPIISSNKKKSRSLVSFFFDKQKIFDTNENIKSIKNNFDVDLSQQKQDPTLIYDRGQSIIPKQWRTTQSIPSPTYNNAQIQFKNHSYEYLQLFDELINENNSCFGFSLSNITSKYCLYMTIIIFLGICLIISLTAIFKK
jgi:hypothetical protein